MKNYSLLILSFICCCTPSSKDKNREPAIDSAFSNRPDVLSETKVKISDEVYSQLNQSWRQHLNIDLPLSRIILKSINGKYNIFTVEQFWDNCSVFEYALVLKSDSSFLTTFPFSVLSSGCEVYMEFLTEQLNDSTFLQNKTFIEPLIEVDTLTREVIDSQITEVEKIKFLITAKGLDTLDYSKQIRKD